MNGYIFDKRFLVKEKLTEGAYGLIFKGVDLMTPLVKSVPGEQLSPAMEKHYMSSNGEILYQPVIFKFTQQIEVNDMEF